MARKQDEIATINVLVFACHPEACTASKSTCMKQLAFKYMYLTVVLEVSVEINVSLPTRNGQNFEQFISFNFFLLLLLQLSALSRQKISFPEIKFNASMYSMLQCLNPLLANYMFMCIHVVCMCTCSIHVYVGTCLSFILHLPQFISYDFSYFVSIKCFLTCRT